MNIPVSDQTIQTYSCEEYQSMTTEPFLKYIVLFFAYAELNVVNYHIRIRKPTNICCDVVGTLINTPEP